jgi:4-amino-4-deoxy-L-arabinose transferase-like glycosyltransferase
MRPLDEPEKEFPAFLFTQGKPVQSSLDDYRRGREPSVEREPMSEEPMSVGIQEKSMARWKAFALVGLLWAAIYLPYLGSEELYGTENNRVLPAMEMLKNHNWVMPKLGGQDYYNKPPGYNWLLAASYAITGQRNEWTVRMPSALFMLVLAAAMIYLPGRWPSIDGRLLAAAVFLAAVGMVNAGRRAEIEAPYLCLTGLALVWWLWGFANGWSRWVTWLGAALLLAYGAMMKGPINGFVFYVAVVCVLAYSRRLKELWSLAHIVGVLLILFICLGWVYLAYKSSADSGGMVSQWGRQWLVRVQPDEQHRTPWLRNVAQALGDMLPWLPLLPVLWLKRIVSRIEPDKLAIYKGCRLGVVIAFVVINAAPATLDRYSLPVWPLTALLLGWALSGSRQAHPADRYWTAGVLVAMLAVCAGAVVGIVKAPAGAGGWAVLLLAAATLAATWRVRKRIVGGLRMGLATAAVLALASLLYVTFVSSQTPPNLRLDAQRINAAMPPGQTLYVYQPMKDSLPFYLREPMEYVLEPRDIGPNVKYLLIQPALLEQDEVRTAVPPNSFKPLAQCSASVKKNRKKEADQRLLIERK